MHASYQLPSDIPRDFSYSVIEGRGSVLGKHMKPLRKQQYRVFCFAKNRNVMKKRSLDVFKYVCTVNSVTGYEQLPACDAVVSVFNRST